MAILKVYLYIIILFIVEDVGENIRKKGEKIRDIKIF